MAKEKGENKGKEPPCNVGYKKNEYPKAIIITW